MSETTRDRLLNACFAFMRNVALFLLRAGISYREFQEIAKRAFVTVATEEFGIRGRPTNASRVAAMTGLSRKEVRVIREQDFRVDEVSIEVLSPSAEVLRGWHTDNRFLDEDGHARPLSVGRLGEFSLLVSEYGGDIPVGAIRYELERVGAVSAYGSDSLIPTSRHFAPADSGGRLLSAISYGLVGLTSTIAFNSHPRRPENPRMERYLRSERIPADRVPTVRAQIETSLRSLSIELDDLLSNNEAERGSNHALGVGLYYTEYGE